MSAVTKTGTYTISMWIKPRNIFDTGVMFQNSPATDDRNGIDVSTNLVEFGYYNGSSWTGKSGSAKLNEWQYVIGINNAGTVSLYLDGVAQIGTSSAYANVSASYFYIGKDTLSTPDYFDGLIDEVMIWNRALSVDDVRSVYQYTRTFIE